MEKPFLPSSTFRSAAFSVPLNANRRSFCFFSSTSSALSKTEEVTDSLQTTFVGDKRLVRFRTGEACRLNIDFRSCSRSFNISSLNCVSSLLLPPNENYPSSTAPNFSFGLAGNFSVWRILSMLFLRSPGVDLMGESPNSGTIWFNLNSLSLLFLFNLEPAFLSGDSYCTANF